jgi:CHASE2 domain-containing sensor protein
MTAITFFAKKRNRIRYFLIGLACLFFIGIIDYMGFFQGMNSYVYDLFFRLRGPEKISGQIVIAAIDEKTLEKLGKWPIGRYHYATFLNRVSNASAVAFDIILAEPSIHDVQLADAIAESRSIVLPVYIDHRQHLVLPSQSLSKAPVGHVHMEPGVDGVLRDVFHTLTHDGKKILSISAVVHNLVFGTPSDTTPSSSPASGADIQNYNSIFQQDRMRINYYGPRGTFPYLSFSDIIENKFPGSFFENKIILLGLTAAGIDQNHLISFSQNRNRMPGVEVQANVLNNLMDGTDIK